MPTVGEQLRRAREARKLQVQEVAEATKMRSDHIIALEEGNYAPFPAPVYVRGSVRSYAKLLNLEVMPIMEALAEELSDGAADGGKHQPGLPRRGLLEFAAYYLASFGWKNSIVVLVLVILVGIVVLVRVTGSGGTEEDPLNDLPAPTYEPAGSEGAHLPLPDASD